MNCAIQTPNAVYRFCLVVWCVHSYETRERHKHQFRNTTYTSGRYRNQSNEYGTTKRKEKQKKIKLFKLRPKKERETG